MMTARGRRSVGRRNRKLASFGSGLGLALALLLTARLVQVHVVRPEGSPVFGLIYSAILLAPFVASITALMKGAGRSQLNVWGISGLIASFLAVSSVSLVVLPLLIPAGLLIAAAATGDADR